MILLTVAASAYAAGCSDVKVMAMYVPAGTYSEYPRLGYGATTALNTGNIPDSHISLFASAGVNRFFLIR